MQVNTPICQLGRHEQGGPKGLCCIPYLQYNMKGSAKMEAFKFMPTLIIPLTNGIMGSKLDLHSFSF